MDSVLKNILKKHYSKIGFPIDRIKKQLEIADCLLTQEIEAVDFANALELAPKQKIIFNTGDNQILLCHGAKRAGKTTGMIVAFVHNIYKFSLKGKKKRLNREEQGEQKHKPRQPAIFLVTATTQTLASSIFLREVNRLFEILDIPERYNDSGHVNSVNIFGVNVKFVGLNRSDAYSKVKGDTVVGWLGTEITEYDRIAFNNFWDRISAGSKTIFWDANPQSTSHWVFTTLISPNRNTPLGTKNKITLLHFNYLDSLTLFEGVEDYWEMMENKYLDKSHLDRKEVDKALCELSKRQFLDPEDKEAHKLLKKFNIGIVESTDKLGLWNASQNEPLKNLVRKSLDLATIRSERSVAFLDLANTANETSCYTALAIVWSNITDISIDYYFTGKLFKQPYYETYEAIALILEYYHVNELYYDLHGAGVGMKDLPQFIKYGSTGLLQSRNKLSRISDLSLLIDRRKLFAHESCSEDFFHQVRSFKFTEHEDGRDIPIKRIQGFCDAPDALESAVRVFVKGKARFNEDDKPFHKILNLR